MVEQAVLVTDIPTHSHSAHNMKELLKMQFPLSLMNVKENPVTDCSLFSALLLTSSNEIDIADISAAALCNGASGDSEAFVKGATLLGRGYEGENLANGLTLPAL